MSLFSKMKWLSLLILVMCLSYGCSKKEEPPPPPPKTDKFPELAQNKIYLTNRPTVTTRQDVSHTEIPEPITRLSPEEEEFFAPTVD